jgi:hypothetical protein
MKRFKQLCAAILPALLLHTPLTSQAQTWTELKVGDFTSLGFFSGGTANLSDGRLVLGSQGAVYVQKTFGAELMNTVPLPAPVPPATSFSIDPAFVALKNDTTAIVGGGFSNSGLFSFNPATPTKAINGTAIATLQNFQGVYWRNPTTKREGWLVVGGNGPAGRNQLGYLSIKGDKQGAIVADVSEYSAGLAVNAAGDVFVARSDINTNAGENNKVYKFSAAQIDSAVAGILAAPAVTSTLTMSNGAFLYQPTAAGGLAVDSWDRVYASGSDSTFTLTGELEIYDPASQTTATITPRTTALPGAVSGSTIGIQPSVFKRKGQSYIAWLAYDGGSAVSSDIIYGYALDTSLDVTKPEVSFATTAQTVTEAAGTVNVTVNLSHRSVTELTLPLTVTGTSDNADRSAPPVSIKIPAGVTTANLSLKITNDKVDEPVDVETCILTLDAPTATDRYTVDPAAQVHTLSINDIHKPVPLAPASFAYPTGAIGSNYGGVFFMDVSPDLFVQPVTYKATGLPPGLSLNAVTGEILGTPTTAGRYENIVITATNPLGSFKLGPYIIDIAGFDIALQGSWVALADRAGTVTGDANNGLGARLDLTASKNAGVTGKLLIGTKSYGFKTQLDTTAGANSINVSIPRKGLTPLVVSLTLDPLSLSMNGSIDDGGSAPATVTGWKAFWSANNSPVARLGLHNVSLKNLAPPTVTEPEGVSYASLKVDSTGKVSVAGRSADGNALTGSAPMGRSGEVLLYQALYKGLGSMSAAMLIAADLPHSVSGTGSWSKKAQPGSKLYAAGWSAPLSLGVQGGLYTAPTTGLLLDANAGGAVTTANAILFFSGANSTSSTTMGDADVRLLPAGKLSLLNVTAPNVVKLTTTPSSGLVRGSFLASMPSVKEATVSFYALVIPDISSPTNPFDGMAEGNFILGQTDGTQLCGSVTLQKLP